MSVSVCVSVFARTVCSWNRVAAMIWISCVCVGIMQTHALVVSTLHEFHTCLCVMSVRVFGCVCMAFTRTHTHIHYTRVLARMWWFGMSDRERDCEAADRAHIKWEIQFNVNFVRCCRLRAATYFYWFLVLLAVCMTGIVRCSALCQSLVSVWPFERILFHLFIIRRMDRDIRRGIVAHYMCRFW